MTVCRDDIKNVSKFLLVSIAGGTTLTYFTCPGCSSSFYRYFVVSAYSSLLWLFLWGGNSLLGSFLDKKVTWTEYPIKRFFIGITLTIVYSISCTTVFMEILEFVLNFRFGDGYMTSLYTSIVITILISFFLHSRGFLLSWREAAKDAEKLQKENAIAKYESLKNQVNPHFLFNSLNALTNLVYEDQDKAVKFIKQLSEVYRYVLDTREREMVDVKEELDFLNSYLFLQSIRFGDNLKTHISLSGQGKIAPLALQMLIENAIKHNVISNEDPLQITITEDNDFIVIENNLQKKNSLGEPSSGIGLENIFNRYKFLSNKVVEIIKSENTFTVKLPIIR